MKLNAKLLVIAFILAIFSVGAVAASENFTAESSDLTQVPHEQVVSVPDSTVQEVEAIDLETSTDDAQTKEVSSSLDEINNVTDSSVKESLKKSKKSEPLLGATDENILSSTITVSGDTFTDIQKAIDRASSRDIIDLGGNTYYKDSDFKRFIIDGKDLTIIGGSNGQKATLIGDMSKTTTNVSSPNLFRGNNLLTIENVDFKEFNDTFVFRNTELVNCDFTDIINGYMNRQFAQGYTFFIFNSSVYNCNFDRIQGGANVFAVGKYQAGKPPKGASQLFYNCTFTNSKGNYFNYETEGGQFLTAYSNTIIDHCTFLNTSTQQHSGAICITEDPENEETRILNSKFINVSSWIGAVYVHENVNYPNLIRSIENCTFINNTALESGGAIATNKNNLLIKECTFINNTAGERGAAIMVGGIDHPRGIAGDNSKGHNVSIVDCYFEGNEAHGDGAVHISGDDALIENSVFHENFAIGGNGSAVYVKGERATVSNSEFYNHECEKGTVYIEGEYAKILDSKFENNVASKGGAGVYVDGDYPILDNNIFRNNNATIHGGAIHTHGDHVLISNSQFQYNNAIPDINNKEQGLGGAIYIRGDNNAIENCSFDHNTARNGSAIYNIGTNLHLTDDYFHDNQAWSYLLFTVIKPNTTSYYNESANTKIEITHIGGDNIINAIHNAGSIFDIFFHNVTYYHSEGVHKTGDDELHPVDGVQNSKNATIIYQDDREDSQVIDVIVTNDETGEKIFSSIGKDLRSGLYGNLTVTLPKGLRPGVYTVNATHPDDYNYTAITNITKFEILPHVDISVTKTSDKDVYVVGENAIFTIRVYGVGTNATNVTVKDFLPKSLKFVSALATQGSYDNKTNIWDIGFLPHGASQTLTLTVQTTELGTFDNVVNVTCTEKDWDLSNNVDNKTIEVNLYYTKEANVTNTSAGEYFEYYLSVYNLGGSLYNQTLRVRDVLPEGVQYINHTLQGADLVKYIPYGYEQIWEITNISAGTHANITIKVKALKDGVWNNTMYVWDFPPVNATVNVSSSADLRVVKEVSVKNAKKGDLIYWTIFVKNEGPSIAMGAYVDDILPAGLEIYGMTSASKGSYNRNTGRWTIGNMAVGEKQNLTITTRVTVSSVNITNEATVNGTTPDPNPDNNYDNDTVEVSPEGDVGVEKTVSVHNVNHGQVIYWTIVVTNHGPDNATGVFVTDALPSGLQYINSTKTKGKDYNPVSGNWYIGDMVKGEKANLTIYTRAMGHNTLINNEAIVNSTSVDTNPNNNKDEDYINIGPEADLELIKVADKHQVVKGDTVTWTITVINHGPNDAIDAYVDDILPKGLEFVSSSSPRRYDNNTGRWAIGHLSNGSNATLTIVTRVLASNEWIENYAIVNSSTYDPDPYNNDDDDQIEVKTEADVGIIKIVSNKTAHYGDTVLWTINVTNYGPNVAENVIVTDLLPAGLIIVGSPSHSQGHVYVDGSGNGIWNIGNLGVNETVSAIINSIINTTDASITNVVKVNTTSHDPNPSNDIAENRTLIPPEADVEVIKTVSNITPEKYDLIVWTITVINHGPNVAENVVVTDILPAGVQYVSDQGLYHNATGKWNVGRLAPNEKQTLNITTKVVDTGKITNEVNVTTTTYETDLTNNYDNETIDVPAIADLMISKEVSNKTPKYGNLINWTITVTNNGPNNARNVVVNDKLPKGLIYVTHNATAGLYDSVHGIWQIGDVMYSKSESIVITTRVNVTNTTITNVAVVTSTTPDSNETNNKANNTTTVGPLADLAIEKIVSDHGPKNGTDIIWTISVTNKGPDAAINAVATDVIPNGLIFVKAEGDGTYDYTTDLWTIGDIENGGTRVLTITTTVNITKAIITNIVNVTSDTPDPDDSNNEDNETIDVGHETDLEIIKIVSNSTPKSGDEIIWNITVINHGPDDAIETIVIDKLPAGLVWISDDSNGAYNHITGVWDIGTLAKNTNVTLLIKTLVNVSGVNITNIANVTTDTHDTNESNNEDNDTIDVPADPKADLEIVKIVSNKNPKFGEEITWTIKVINNGPDTAYNVTVSDKLPAGLIYKTDDSNGKYNPTTGVWDIGELANKEPRVLVITTIVDITNSTITNIAVVNSTTPDPNEENNKATNNTTVAPEADLEIIKLVSDSTAKKGDTIIWTITVTNKGPDTALNVLVKDKLPTGLVLTGYSVTDGLFDSNSMTWLIQSLAKGNSQNLTLKTLVNVTNITLTNTVNVTNDVYDPNKTNNEANNNTTVVPEADLQVIKTAMNTAVKKGDYLFWNITIINHGPDTVTRIMVADHVQNGLVFVAQNGTLSTDQVITRSFNVTLEVGQSTSIYIKTLVNESNVNLTNEVIVVGNLYDPIRENNYDNDTVEVLPVADLVVVKTVSSNVTKTGDEITWTVTVTNNGPDAAVNTRVTDKLPSGLIYNGHKADVGNYDHESGVWIVGDLASGASKTLTIKSIVNITNKTIVNVANVTSDTPGNKTNDTNKTTSYPKADLVVVKEVSNKNPKFGEEITWTITVTNKGPDVAVNTKVTDKLPNGLIFVKSNGDYNNGTGVWNVGDLANGQSKSLVITTIVNITNAIIENIANATSDTPGNRTPGNNTTEVGSIADLEVVKLVSNTTAKSGDIITWTIIVTNKGPDAADSVNVTDKLPAGLTYKNHKADKGLYDPSSGVWSIGDMAKGQSLSLVINTTVDIVNGTVVNVAVVNSSTPDNNTDNNKANNTTTVNENADLVIVKEVSNKNPHKGDVITWTITVTNKGPSDAKNVKVTDKLPAGLVFNGSNGAYNPETGVWNVGDLANGKSASLVITTLVNITNKAITNVANVTSDTPDSNKTNNEANNTTDVPPEADIATVKEVNATECVKDQIVEWTITMTNHGPDAATNVIVKDNLPDTLIFISADGNYNPETGVWTIDNLASGETKVLTIITKINATDIVIVNNVTAASGVYDPDMSNNNASNSTTVIKETLADLEVVKVVSNANPHKGDIITWTITVTNNGPDSAKDVTVTDKLPSGLVYVEDTGKGAYNPSNGVWTIGDLENGKSVSLVITTKVDISNANVTNIAVVNSTTPDNNKNNNKDNDTTSIESEADIGVIKTVSNPKPSKGDIITWTVVVTNFGPDAAENVYVEELLPDGLTLLSVKGSKGSYEDGIWTIGTLDNGQTATLTLTTRVTVSGGSIENVVVADSSTYDPNRTNNKDKETTHPKEKSASADLELTKVASKDKVKVGDLIVWTITVINHGPDKAVGVYVQDILDAGDVEFVSADPNVGEFDEDTGMWNIGDMEVGETATLIITFRALSEGVAINYAEVMSETPDSNLKNNHDSSTVHIVKDKPVPKTPKTPKGSHPTMHATGNPIVMVLLALLAIAGITLRRRN